MIETQTQNSKFEPWRSEAEHATTRSRRFPTILTFTHGWGRNIFVSLKPPRPGTEPRTLAWKAAVLTTTLGPPPNLRWSQSSRWKSKMLKITLINLPRWGNPHPVEPIYQAETIHTQGNQSTWLRQPTPRDTNLPDWGNHTQGNQSTRLRQPTPRGTNLPGWGNPHPGEPIHQAEVTHTQGNQSTRLR